MALINRLKHAVNDWLKRLADTNAATFGGATPDCCSLNKQSNVKGAAYGGQLKN